MAADLAASPEFTPGDAPGLCAMAQTESGCEAHHKRPFRFGVSGGGLPGLEKLEVLKSHARACSY
jgi:hypothetical protein